MSRVVVLGHYFVAAAALRCQFWADDDGITDATFLNESAVSCFSPPRATAKVVSVTILQDSLLTRGLTFHYFSQPTLFTMTPYYGEAAGGTDVQIEGTGLVGYASHKHISCRFAPRSSNAAVIITSAVLVDGNVECRSPPSHTVAGGTAVVDVSLNGQQFTEASTLVFVYFPAADNATGGTPRYTVATNSIAIGPGIQVVRAGELARFSILARDQFGQPAQTTSDEFSISVPGEAPASVAVAAIGNYTVQYMPTKSGPLLISVSMFNYAISGSPFAVQVVAGEPDPQHSVFAGPGLAWNYLASGEATFDVFAAELSVRDTHDNPASLSDPELLEFKIMAPETLDGNSDALAMSVASMQHQALLNASGIVNSSFSFSATFSTVGDHILSVKICRPPEVGTDVDSERSCGRVMQSPFGFVTRWARAVEVTDAFLSEKGDSLTVAFGRATNRAGAESVPARVTCLACFDSASVDSFGYDAKCEWNLNGTAVNVLLGAGTTVQSASSLKLKFPSIYSSLLNSLPSNLQFRVGLPKNDPTAPIAVLDYPSVVGKCSAFSLDASASFVPGEPLKRPLQYRWRLIAGMSSYQLRFKLKLASANEDLKFNGDSSVRLLLYDLASDQTYVFEVVVTSSLNVSSAPTYATIYKSEAEDLPRVYIDGASELSVASNQNLELHGGVEPSSCSSQLADAEFEWSQSDSNHPVQLGRTDSSVLSLPPNSLHPGKAYRFTLTGRMKSASNSTASPRSNYAHANVAVAPAGVVAVLVGGDERSVSVHTDIMLDATASLDLDRSAEVFTYDWACADAAGESCGDEVQQSFATRSARDGVVVVAAGLLRTGTYVFSVSCSKPTANTHDSASVRISVRPALSPMVTISTPFVKLSTRVNPAFPLLLVGATMAGGRIAATYSWESSPDLPTAGEAVSSTLTVAAGELQAGREYTFRLTAAAGGSDGYAQLRIQTNAPPCCGAFRVDPMSGAVAMVDSLRLSAENWWDAPEDLPLSVRYFRKNSDDASLLPLAVGAPGKNTAEVYSSEGLITLVLRVADVHGAATTKSTNVTVLPLVLVPGDQVSVLDASFTCDTKIKTLLSRGNRRALDQVLQLVSIVAQLLGTADARRRRLAGDVCGLEDCPTQILRKQMLEHVLAVSARSVVTAEMAQMQAHAIGSLSARPPVEGTQPWLSPLMIDLILSQIASVAVAELSTVSQDVYVTASSARALMQSIGSVLESSMSEARENDLAPNTPLATVWTKATDAMTKVLTYAAHGALLCGQPALRVRSTALNSVVSRECVAEGMGRNYSVTAADSTRWAGQSLQISTPLFDIADGGFVSVAMTSMGVAAATLSDNFTVVSPVLHVVAWDASGIAATLRSSQCIGMSLPTDNASKMANFFPTCAAWSSEESRWSRLDCTTSNSELGGMTQCCCQSATYYTVLMLPICPAELYPEQMEWCIARAPDPEPEPEPEPTSAPEPEPAKSGPTVQCPDGCSGHGSCGEWVSNSGSSASPLQNGWTGVCICDEGYTATVLGCEERRDIVQTVRDASTTSVIVPVLVVALLGLGLGCWYHLQRQKAAVQKIYEDRVNVKAHSDVASCELVVSDMDQDKAWLFMSSAPAVQDLEKQRPPPLLARQLEATPARDPARRLPQREGKRVAA
eukprot:COSAG05_NODE_574_length_8600_cov_2.783790_4_plen_1640_part_00